MIVRFEMSELSKRARKQARELAAVAYTRELTYHLDKLSLKFDDWRKSALDCWELNDFIHKFHDVISRELYKMYNNTTDEILLISQALVRGFLKSDEVYKELLELSRAITSHFKINENDEDQV
jgi:hypothetical protein